MVDRSWGVGGGMRMGYKCKIAEKNRRTALAMRIHLVLVVAFMIMY